LIPEREGDNPEDPRDIIRDITEAPNQSSGDINISDPSPTNKGKPRIYFIYTAIYIYKYTCALSF
jgi:hypothetical protein